MSMYAETGATPRPRASTYCNRPLPPLPDKTTTTPTTPTGSDSGGRPARKRRCTIVLSPSRLSQFPTPPPTLLPKEQVNALSLQDTTFLYLLSNVDRYPTHLLGLMPLHLRRKLLSSLPPFRLYLLEKTSVANGVDTDEIWAELSRLQDCVWGNYLTGKNRLHKDSTDHTWSGGRETLRERFVNYLSHLLFNEMNRDYACKRITELLHATHVDMLDKSVANALIYGHVNSLFMFQPPYYLIPFRCPNLTERELYWSLFGNKMLPRSLELYVYNMDSSPLWNQELISQEMMRRLFSKLQSLRIYNHMYKTMQLEEILNAVTHSSRYKEPPSVLGSLKHLELLRADDRHLSTVVPFFTGPNGYSTLTSITISMRPVHYIQATRHLGPLIRHQLNSLQHLELQGFSCCISKNVIHMSDYMFFTSLVSFILKPRFQSLILRGFKDLPWLMLEMLLEANLRTVPSHSQTILLDDVNVTTRGSLPFWIEEDDEEREENQFCPAAESKCLEHKRIRFQNSRIPEDVLNWFQKTDRVCVNTLEFNQVKVQSTTPAHHMGIRCEYINGVAYGFHCPGLKKITEQELKSKFLNHDNFECCVFSWQNVQVDNNCLLSV